MFRRAIVIVAGAVSAALATPAWAVSVSDVRFGGAGTTTRVVVETSRPLSAKVFALKGDTPRVVVDIPRVGFDMKGESIGASQWALPGEGVVSRVRYAHRTARASRIVLDLKAGAVVGSDFALPPVGPGQPYRYVIDLEHAGGALYAAKAAPAPRQPRIKPTPPQPVRRDVVVVIDPGHGGRDPGAIGRGGLREKDVNLAVAKLIRDELERQGGYDVVMTREDDRYVEHEDRVKIARDAKADLFLSLHADSAPRGRTVRGASVYTLAERARGRSRTEIFEKDPRLLDVDLRGRPNEVSNILVDLAQRQTVDHSPAFAQTLLPRLDKIGPIVRNPHREAGFYVLLAPDVPAVLLEMGFLSDRRDEARLKSTRERKKLAGEVVGAIDDYFETVARLYESP